MSSNGRVAGLIKHVRLVHLTVVLASVAIATAILVEREPLRVRAEEEFQQLQRALLRWRDLDLHALSTSVKAPLRPAAGHQPLASSAGDSANLEDLLLEIRGMTTEDEELLSRGFPDTYAADIERFFSGYLVLVGESKFLVRSVTFYLLIDPISCSRGGLPATTLGELREFWSDMVQPNTCYLLKGLSEFPVISEADIPESESWSVGAVAYQDVVVVAEGLVLDSSTCTDEDPHDALTTCGLRANVMLLGARDNPADEYRATWPHVSVGGTVSVREFDGEPLLPHFGGESFPRAPFSSAFPALARLTKDYPADLGLENLAKVMTLEAQRDTREIRPLPGLALPGNLSVALGLPILVVLVAYLCILLGEFQRSFTKVSGESEEAWLGLFPSPLAGALIYSSLAIPTVAGGLGFWNSIETDAGWVTQAIAFVSFVLVAAGGIVAVRAVQRIRRTTSSVDRM